MIQNRTMAAASAERLFQDGVRLQQQGSPREAAGRYEAVLRQVPDHLGALQLLGVIHAQQGRPDRALGLLQRAVERYPASAEAHNNIGMVLHALKRGPEAVAHYEAALAINPRYAIACNNLGIALGGMERRADEIASYQRALAIRPDYPEATNNLGNALQAAERYDEASAQFSKALALRPDFHDARMNLGLVLAALNRPDEAIAAFQAVLRAQPDNAATHTNLGTLLQGLNRHEEAVTHFTRARDLRPDSAQAAATLGVALQERGDIDQARACFKRAVALEPREAGHYARLALTMRFTGDDPYLDAMLALSREELAEAEQISLGFALGKALTDAGEPAAGFEHLMRANAAKRRFTDYNEAAMIGPVEAAQRVFTPALMHRHAGVGDPSRAPIFIVGMPRSGSTLVEQILASHPAVFAAGEVLAFRQAMRGAGAHTKDVRFPETVPALTAARINDVASRYLRSMRAMQPANAAPQRFTDKMLFNFRCAGLIHLALPNARIIHTSRDPVDTCLSIFSLDFINNPYAYDLGELGRYYRAYAGLMRHWQSVLPDGVMLDVRYEDVVADLEGSARRIIAHCGLDWDDACLSFHKTERTVKTLSFAQVRQPLYRSSVGRWRPPDDVLRPLLDALGPDHARP